MPYVKVQSDSDHRPYAIERDLSTHNVAALSTQHQQPRKLAREGCKFVRLQSAFTSHPRSNTVQPHGVK